MSPAAASRHGRRALTRSPSPSRVECRISGRRDPHSASVAVDAYPSVLAAAPVAGALLVDPTGPPLPDFESETQGQPEVSAAAAALAAEEEASAAAAVSPDSSATALEASMVSAAAAVEAAAVASVSPVGEPELELPEDSGLEEYLARAQQRILDDIYAAQLINREAAARHRCGPGSPQGHASA